MKRRTVIVDGPLSCRMRRYQAARHDEIGLEILTLPRLAARLAAALFVGSITSHAILGGRHHHYVRVLSFLVQDNQNRGYCHVERSAD